MSNTRAGQGYTLNIINLLKDDSLYCDGMLPLAHSERRMQQEVGGPCALSVGGVGDGLRGGWVEWVRG